MFKGKIYFDESRNGYYKWSLTEREDILYFHNYIKNTTSYTINRHRILMLPLYFELLDLKAYQNVSPLHKAWLNFNIKWNKYS